MNVLMLRTRRTALFAVRRTVRYQTSTAVQTTDLLEYYRGLVARGDLRWDDEQVRCVMHVRCLPMRTCLTLGTVEEAVGYTRRL